MNWSALRADCPLPPGRFLVVTSHRGWVNPRAIARLDGVGYIEKSNSLFGNRTRDLPACSIVPQPTMLQGHILYFVVQPVLYGLYWFCWNSTRELINLLLTIPEYKYLGNRNRVKQAKSHCWISTEPVKAHTGLVTLKSTWLCGNQAFLWKNTVEYRVRQCSTNTYHNEFQHQLWKWLEKHAKLPDGIMQTRPYEFISAVVMKRSAIWEVTSYSPFKTNGRCERKQRRASLSIRLHWAAY
jgi:hypothetical protein